MTQPRPRGEAAPHEDAAWRRQEIEQVRSELSRIEARIAELRKAEDSARPDKLPAP